MSCSSKGYVNAEELIRRLVFVPAGRKKKIWTVRKRPRTSRQLKAPRPNSINI